LDQPGHQRWRRRHQPSDLAKCIQDVVGSYGRYQVPNNHSKYRIPGVPLIRGPPAGVHREDRGASVHAPHSLAGQALDLHAVHSEERLGRRSRLISPDPGEGHFPLGRLERHGA
jgi:hypothetical protein